MPKLYEELLKVGLGEVGKGSDNFDWLFEEDEWAWELDLLED